MKKSSLIELLSEFSQKEFKEFGEFVHSSFFNKNQSVIKLYDYLRKVYPDFEYDLLQKQYVYDILFPNVEYNDGFMRTIIFNLYSLAEEYLSYIRYKRFPFIVKRNLLYELNERKLDKQIERKLKEIKKELNAEKMIDSDYFYNKFIIDYEEFYFLNRLNIDKVDRFINNSEVQGMFDHLTYYYLLHAIKLYIYFLNSKELYSTEFKTEHLEDIIINIKPEFYEDLPVFMLYYNVLMLHLKEDDISYFYKVKEQVQKYENIINEFQETDTYINLENYCKSKIRKGMPEFISELFEIINIEIEKKKYLVQGMMSPKYYISAVEIGIKTCSNEWTKEFIEKYKGELPDELRENTYNYASAIYQFSLKNFEESLELLSKVKYNEIYQKTEVRCLMAALYYEMNYENNLFSHLDSFRHCITNEKHMPENRKKYYCNFIKHLKNLQLLKDSDNENAMPELKQKINDENSVYNKEWLLDKAEELEKIRIA
jgi:hypothetical protein